MGKLVNGVWRDVWYDTESSDGEFVREDAGFRRWLTVDGSNGPEGQQGFKLSRSVITLCFASLPLGAPNIDFSPA